MSKKKIIEIKKADKVVLFIIGIIILIIALFKIVSFDSKLYDESCTVVVSRVAYGYVGVVTEKCNEPSDCKGTRFVYGRLLKSEYKDIDNKIKVTERVITSDNVCKMFEE